MALKQNVGYRQRDHKVSEIACGPFTVDLISTLAGKQEKLSDERRQVASCLPFGAMHPINMLKSLRAEGFTPHITPGAYKQDIKNAIDRDCPAILFFGTGYVGHWITVVDSKDDDFFVFDNREFGEEFLLNQHLKGRNVDGIVSIDLPLLMYWWNKTPLLLETLQCSKKFRIEPRTLITPW